MKAFVSFIALIAIALSLAGSAKACDVNQFRLGFSSGYAAPLAFNGGCVQQFVVPQQFGYVQSFAAPVYAQPFVGYSAPFVGYAAPFRSFGFSAYGGQAAFIGPRRAFVGPGRAFRRTPFNPFIGPVPRRW